MKKNRCIRFIIVAIVVILCSGGITSQAKTENPSLSKKKITLRVGQKQRLKVNGASGKISWSSSNKEVVAVSGKGLLIGKKKGKAVIKAKVGKKTLRAKVVVKKRKDVRAVMTINGTEYGMAITDTTIGRAFAKKLQDEGSYTVTGSRAEDDICCSESETLETDPTENMPWVCGGVAWTGDWFTVWVSKEAAGRDMPVVAQIDEEHLEELQALNGSMEIEVRLVAK